jgi:hypothetical protein
MFSVVDFLYGIALNLLLKLFLEGSAILPPGPATSPPVQYAIAESVQPVRIPDWVNRVPKDGFVGISGFCTSIEEARQQALHSAISQIVQNMGAEYTLSHESRVSGNALSAHHELKERLTYTARWFVSSVNENILESDIQEIKGKYVCFVLVKYPRVMIEKLRKLTIGAKAGARILSKENGRVNVEVRENNGVEIILTEYEVKLTTTNRHADIVTMFFMKVPTTESQTGQSMLEKKVSVKNNARTLLIGYPASAPGIKSFILGSETEIRIVLHGYDEIGRPVTIPVGQF